MKIVMNYSTIVVMTALTVIVYLYTEATVKNKSQDQVFNVVNIIDTGTGKVQQEFSPSRPISTSLTGVTNDIGTDVRKENGDVISTTSIDNCVLQVIAKANQYVSVTDSGECSGVKQTIEVNNGHIQLSDLKGKDITDTKTDSTETLTITY